MQLLIYLLQSHPPLKHFAHKVRIEISEFIERFLGVVVVGSSNPFDKDFGAGARALLHHSTVNNGFEFQLDLTFAVNRR